MLQRSRTHAQELRVIFLISFSCLGVAHLPPFAPQSAATPADAAIMLQLHIAGSEAPAAIWKRKVQQQA
jgi:pyridoxal biosynthesis lyase PdxS